MSIDTLASWHELVKNPNLSSLDALLDNDVVFFSPVVHTPQVGKAITTQYLLAALHVFGDPSFTYVSELTAEGKAVLEFELELGGIQINGIDMISWNEHGKIIEFKVMIRPLKAIQLIHQKMGASLQEASPQRPEGLA